MHPQPQLILPHQVQTSEHRICHPVPSMFAWHDSMSWVCWEWKFAIFLGEVKEKLAFILIFHISGGNYLCIADSPCCSCISLSASWWINNTWVDQVDQTTKNDLNNQQTNLIYPTHPSVQSKQASSAASSNPHPNSWIQHSCWNHTCRHTSPFSKISARIDSHDAHGKTKSGAHLTCCVNTVR